MLAVAEVIKNVDWSQKVWREAVKFHPALSGFFHLRARSKDITVVSTHPDKPMNGRYCNKRGGNCKPALSEFLTSLANEIDHLDGAQLTKLEFERKGTSEDSLQAQFINDINAGRVDGLKKALGVQELLFVASELILFEGGDESMLRPDVVALGDGNIFLIEMKTLDSPDNEVSQALHYVKYYQHMEAYYKLINGYLGEEKVACRKTKMIGVGMRGYRTGVVPDIDVVDGVYKLDYRKA